MQSFVSEFVKNIHDECGKYPVCMGCAFYENGCCMFNDNPELWDINKIIERYYKLLKGGKQNETNSL